MSSRADMYPKLFEIFGQQMYSYGFMISLGTVFGWAFTSYHAKKQFNIHPEKITNLLLFIFIAAFIGGKVFFYFEDPSYYFSEPSRMFKNVGSGFVFYGSLLFSIPVLLWYLRKEKLPLLPMLDIMAVTAVIAQFFGRAGCFMAGCCYGKETHSDFGIVFTNPDSSAPIDVSLHPSQLYSMGMLLTIGLILLYLGRKKMFSGQLFLIYLMMYAFGRSILEIFRGDLARGFIIDDVLSHSQFISLLIIVGVGVVYFYLKRKQPKVLS